MIGGATLRAAATGDAMRGVLHEQAGAVRPMAPAATVRVPEGESRAAAWSVFVGEGRDLGGGGARSWPPALREARRGSIHAPERRREVKVAEPAAPRRRYGITIGDVTYLRPRTRAECADSPRPCPWVSCRHHLAIELALVEGRRRAGSLRLNRAPSAPASGRNGRRRGIVSATAGDIVQRWIADAVEHLAAMEATCALDVPQRYPGGLPSVRVGRMLGVAKQQIERDEQRARARARARAEGAGLGAQL